MVLHTLKSMDQKAITFTTTQNLFKKMQQELINEFQKILLARLK
ncbi:hypothetical protein BH20BAC1_BH20BAC1_04520 [soil metagenome]